SCSRPHCRALGVSSASDCDTDSAVHLDRTAARRRGLSRSLRADGTQTSASAQREQHGGGSPTLRRFAAWATRPAIHYTGRVSGSRWPIGWIFALVIGLIAWVVFSKWQESDSGSVAPPPAAVADHANHADHDDHSAHAGHATLAA